jgi:hypothetical protein
LYLRLFQIVYIYAQGAAKDSPMKSRTLVSTFLGAATLSLAFFPLSDTFADVEVMVKITNPVFSRTGVPYAGSSDLNGICISLGYREALEGSLETAGGMYTIQVDAKGYGKAQVVDYWVTGVKCVGRTKIYPNENATKIVNPRHSLTQTRFSQSESSENGICKNLGYNRALPDSTRATGYGDGSGQRDFIKIGEDGTTASVVRSYGVDSIVCID